MKTHLLQAAASARLEDIYRHTLQNFGATQADTYLDGLFALFETIADRSVTWRRIPHEFGVEGYYARYRSHFVFWRQAADDEIATVAILHQRMDVARRLREDVSGP